jgi:light-harvesting complex II chlorophyll a/b binding protein 4
MVCFLLAGKSLKLPASLREAEPLKESAQTTDGAESDSVHSLGKLLLARMPGAAFASSSGPHQLTSRGNSQRGKLRPKMQDATTLKNWIPGLQRPSYLDGTYAGDVGFDPLGLVNLDGPWWDIAGAQSPARRLAWMREAEIKHARLAMVGATGWPLSELWHGPLAKALGLPFELDLTQGRAPSVLNGNLGEASPILFLALLFASYLEVKSLDQVHGLTALGKTISDKSGDLVMKSYSPGDLGFDPLGMYDFYGSQPGTMDVARMEQDPEYEMKYIFATRKEMELAEIKNGRLAMLAITGFALQEALWQTPVVDQTPIFFSSLLNYL